MLEAIKRDPPDILLCTAIDRLSRDPEHTAKIHKLLKHHRVALHTTHGGQPSDLEIGLRSTLNAEFIAETARKTRDGVRHAVRKGKAAAGLAYGYKVKLVYDERGERVPGYRQIVLRIFEEYAAGISPQKIADRLNAEAVPFPGKGTAWRDSTIRGSRSRGLGIPCKRSTTCRLLISRPSSIRRGVNMARSLVQRVIIAPREPRGVSLEVHARLATILASIEAWNREEKRIRAEQHERFIEQRTGGAFKSTQDRIDFMNRVTKKLTRKGARGSAFKSLWLRGPAFIITCAHSK